MRNFEDVYRIARRPGLCACGKKHELKTEKIILRSGALEELPGVIKARCPEGRALMVCDANTYGAAGARAAKMLEDAGVLFDTFRFKNGVAADEHAVETLKKAAGSADFFLAVGSGTVNDICRYTAFHTGKFFISVPTAPSMDGYVSSVAAMTFGGFKVTEPALPPVAVVADTAVLAASPMKLRAAGVGDILGKYTCLCDWEISSLVTEETFCAELAALEHAAAREVLDLCGELKNGGEEAAESLIYALLLSGLAMQLNGDSRPASGAEHHLSHFWEMRFLREGRAPALHGAKVGVATAIIADLYHGAEPLFQNPPRRVTPVRPSPGELAAAFGAAAEGIVKENTPDPDDAVNFDKLVKNRGRIAEVIARLPDGQVFRNALETLGAPCVPAGLGIDEELTQEGLKYCMLIRRRMTLLRLLRLIG